MKKTRLTKADQHLNYLKSEKRLNPHIATLNIILIYFIVGFLWIFLSDELLAMVVTNPQTFQQLQLYKGWFYVFASAIVFYLIIYNQMKKYVQKIAGLDLAYLELDKAHQELLSFERQLHQAAYYDELTGLPSKTSLIKSIRQFNHQYKKDQKPYALIYLDVDDFRDINELYGYEAGDHLLKHIAKILSELIISPNVVARISEDEFIILLTVKDSVDAMNEAKRIIETLHMSYEIQNQSLTVSFSAGVSMYPLHGEDYLSLLRSADTALLFAKKSGKNKPALFESDMYFKRTYQIEMLQNMKQAIKNDDFMLYFQPIYDLKTGKISSIEALIRWSHVEKGFISPLEFIPLAEMTGLIHDINDWVFLDVFHKHNAWKDVHLENIKIAINVSAKSLTNLLFVSRLKALCLEQDVACNCFTLEVTETAMIEDLEATENTLKELGNMGFEIALDDFGTGYSSLTYLKRLPIDIIKIDRAFISDCIDHANDKETLRYLIELAHHLKMKVVAEGIETKDQLDLLKALDCDFAQGFYLGRPMPADQIIETISKDV